MASRYITGNNFEIQVRNCFSSIKKAVEQLPAYRFTALPECNIVGVHHFQFTNFKNPMGYEEINEHSEACKYRLNRRYSLTVSGEYSDNSFTVLLTIGDKHGQSRFGFKVLIRTVPDNEQVFHIAANVPMYGVQVIINYNPETNFYVCSIRPPLTLSDAECERTIARENNGPLICLNVDFIRDEFYQVVNQIFRRETVQTETIADELECHRDLWQVVKYVELQPSRTWN